MAEAACSSLASLVFKIILHQENLGEGGITDSSMTGLDTLDLNAQ